MTKRGRREQERVFTCRNSLLHHSQNSSCKINLNQDFNDKNSKFDQSDFFSSFFCFDFFTGYIYDPGLLMFLEINMIPISSTYVMQNVVTQVCPPPSVLQRDNEKYNCEN